MRSVLSRVLVIGSAIVALLSAPVAGAAPFVPPPLPPNVPPALAALLNRPWQDIANYSCAMPATPDTARCGAVRRFDKRPQPTVRSHGSPYGFDGYYGPADLWSAYNLAPSPQSFNSAPPFVWNGQTVAIVDAYNDPRAESDLQTYRAQFNLPVCTHSNGCFLKINQNGQQGSYPFGNSGWSEEISLDVDMVSAICPDCRILLVEARTANFNDLGAAVDEAAKLNGRYNGYTWTHATAISNSYGANEFGGETFYDQYYNHPGIPITASTGDGGFGVEYPAASAYVTAVGGTSLTHASGTARGWAEGAWSGAGSGCSVYVARPSWQTATADCGMRSVADVSAVADPNTGVLVYDTFGLYGWYVFGGTSVASPIVASAYALAGNAAQINNGSYSYSHIASLYDVTSGSNGSCGNYLCNAGPGYDGPTGNGTPNGTGAF